MKLRLLLLLAAVPAAALAQAGESTYKSVCASCHASGVANAPKLGDQKNGDH